MRTGEVTYQNFFDGSAILELTLNSSSTLVFAMSQDRKLMAFDATSMEKKGEVVVGDQSLHKMTISPDDSTIVVSDNGCNLIFIDITDASAPKVKAKDKIEMQNMLNRKLQNLILMTF